MYNPVGKNGEFGRAATLHWSSMDANATIPAPRHLGKAFHDS